MHAHLAGVNPLTPGQLVLLQQVDDASNGGDQLVAALGVIDQFRDLNLDLCRDRHLQLSARIKPLLFTEPVQLQLSMRALLCMMAVAIR